MGWHLPLLLSFLGAASLSVGLTRPRAWAAKRAHALTLLITLLWYSSPWAQRAMLSESWHMANHLTMAMVVAPLTLWVWTAYRSEDEVAPTPRRLWANPLVTIVLMASVTPLFHLTSWGVTLMSHPSVNSLEMLAFYLVGLAYFRLLLSHIDGVRLRKAAERFAYLAAVIPIFGVTGLLMAFSRHAPHMTGMMSSPSQSVRGALMMWILGGGFLTLYAFLTAVQWAKEFSASRRTRLV